LFLLYPFLISGIWVKKSTSKMGSHSINFNPKQIEVQNPGNHSDIQPNIMEAVQKAQIGDEILIPEGTFQFNKSVYINKFISIKGKGIKKTILYRSDKISDKVLCSEPWSCFFNFDINNSASCNIIVSDLCMKSKTPSVVDGDGNSLAPDFGIKWLNCIGFTVTRCRFENFGYAAISVQHTDSIARGLIFKNDFFNNVKSHNGLELGYGILIVGANKKWITENNFGTSNFIFIEDNLFNRHRHAIAAGGCALYVFRHNTVLNNNIGEFSGQAVDAHEGRGTPGLNHYSARAVEIYNNSIVNTTFKNGKPIVKGQRGKQLVENAILIRGGEAVIYNNYIEGYRFGAGIINFVVKGVQPYPIVGQIGYISGLKNGSNHTGINSKDGDGDLFCWNNTFQPYASEDTSCVFYNYQPQYFKESRDYHLTKKPDYKAYTYPYPFHDGQKASTH
jgi:hypothetical protein